MPFRPFKKHKSASITVDKSAQLEHQRLTSLINSMADAVIAVDEDIKVVLYNAATLNILDVNNIKSGVELTNLLKPLDTENHEVNIKDMVLATKVPQTSRDLRVKYSDGSLINLYLSIAPVHLGYGKEGQKGYVLMLRDITREKSLEEERDEFISVISHELRTPVTIAEGNISNAQLIFDKEGYPTTMRKALREAHTQVLFLSDMINDLSTLSRAERNMLELQVESINVHELVDSLIENYTPNAKQKGLELKSDLDTVVSNLFSSKLYVREVLQNFITNAIKYTAQGTVTIHARALPNGVRFAVSDTGIGISKGDQERVFDKFFRSEDFRTREANGTGLGLYVTAKLANLLHAEISLNSELNKGSSFTIFIPNLEQPKEA